MPSPSLPYGNQHSAAELRIKEDNKNDQNQVQQNILPTKTALSTDNKEDSTASPTVLFDLYEVKKELSNSRLGSNIRRLLQKPNRRPSTKSSDLESEPQPNSTGGDKPSPSSACKLPLRVFFRRREYSHQRLLLPTPTETQSSLHSNESELLHVDRYRQESSSRSENGSNLLYKLSQRLLSKHESNYRFGRQSQITKGFDPTEESVSRLSTRVAEPTSLAATSYNTTLSNNKHGNTSLRPSPYPAMPLTTRRRFHNLPRGSLEAAMARGLLVATSASGPLPSILSNGIEIIPQRLYWLTYLGTNRPTASETHFFNLDNELVYEPFFADFGPLNLGHTFRYCELLEEKLTDPLLANKRIVHYTAPDLHKRPNAAYLMVAFCVTIMRWSPDAAATHFDRLHPPLLPFRDATYGTCSYQLTILDCAKGLSRAAMLGWFDFDTFDITTYENYERLENGDLNWIIPNKFIAFSGPESRRIEDDSYITFTPHEYIPIFKEMGVTLVIRLNKKQYDRKVFTSQGIDHVDLYFLDGSCPSRDLLNRFLQLCERESGAIAVHCKAGLGRTGTLIGCYAIKHYGFTGPEWIAWNRICRPGSVLGPQQYFLCEIEKELRGTRILQPAISQSVHDSTDLTELLQEMTLDDRKTAEKGDSGQGLRLVNSKRHPIKTSTNEMKRSSTILNNENVVELDNAVSTRLAANDDEETLNTPAYSRSAFRYSVLTPTAAQPPVATLAKRIQPENSVKSIGAPGSHSLSLIPRPVVNN